jgi:chaperonin cofactor prefoldin
MEKQNVTDLKKRIETLESEVKRLERKIDGTASFLDKPNG